MAENLRKTGGREELDELWRRHNCLMLLLCFATLESPALDDGTTDGKIKTTVEVDYTVAGVRYTKAATDDLFDLSAETNTTASQYRAYWLYLDSSGTASIAAGSNETTEALALANLPALVETKSIIGVYVADPSCDFNGAAGLAAQGTIYNGIPAGVPCGVPRKTYSAPELVTLVPG